MKQKTKILLLLMCFSLVFSCKTKKINIENNQQVSKINQQILENHEKSLPEFKTISSNLTAIILKEYKQNSIPLTLRIKKDEIIWISAPLGVAKVLITPEKVSYYNKLESVFFEGDFKFVENFLGFKLNYKDIENLLLGQVIFQDEVKKSFKSQKNIENHQEISTETQNLIIKNSFTKFFRVYKTDITSREKNINLNVIYDYQVIDNERFPQYISMEIVTEEGKNNIDISVNSVEKNKDLTFPYKIPSGYKPLTIK